jgi:Secretin and TonB N terminus short domain/TonB C terminal
VILLSRPSLPSAAARLRGIVLAGGVGLLVAGAAAGGEDDPAAFDIPAQPLMAALDAYSAATGLQVVYDGALVAGRQSNAVRGRMAPDAALRSLLNGTGLVVLYAAPDVFSLLPERAMEPARARRIGDYMPYLAAVQGSIEAAFCSRPLTAPGAYRIEFSFRIDPAGRVSRAQLLGSTGERARDRAIAGLLDGLTIDRPPPPDMPQPVVMAISPRGPAETGDCDAGDAALRRAAAP